MAIYLRRNSNNVKPPLGASLNQGHPLASNLVGAWLFNEKSGLLARSLINANDVLTLVGSWADAYSTTAFIMDGGGSGTGTHALLTTPSSALQPANVVSLYWRGWRFGSGTLTNNPTVAGMTFTNSNTTPFYAYSINRVNGSNTDLFYIDDMGLAGNNAQQVTVLANNTNTQLFDAALTVRSGGNAVGYFNGRQVCSSARSNTLRYGTPRLILNDDFSTENGGTDVDVLYIWNRELSATENLWLHTDPYDLLNWETPKNRRYFGAPFLPGPLIPYVDPQMPQLLAQ